MKKGHKPSPVRWTELAALVIERAEGRHLQIEDQGTIKGLDPAAALSYAAYVATWRKDAEDVRARVAWLGPTTPGFDVRILVHPIGGGRPYLTPPVIFQGGVGELTP